MKLCEYLLHNKFILADGVELQFDTINLAIPSYKNLFLYEEEAYWGSVDQHQVIINNTFVTTTGLICALAPINQSEEVSSAEVTTTANVLNIYLKENTITKDFDLYLNGVHSNSLYKASSYRLGVITPKMFLDKMVALLHKHILVDFKSYCSELKFYNGTSNGYNFWAKDRNLLTKEQVTVVIQGLDANGDIIPYTYTPSEVVKEAIIESERLPIPKQSDWICHV